MIIIAAAIFNDLAGWIIFAMILGMMEHQSGHGMGIVQTIGLTLLFAAGTLTLGRWLIHRVLPWVKAYTSWPGGILGFALALALLAAALTEYIGVHAIFGSFLVGVAIGDSSHLREQTRMVIHQFVSFIFAPLFFASIGLTVDFVRHFDVGLVLAVLVIACVGKVGGCGLGARWSGIPSHEAWALGFGMNARGAMEIILGLLALAVWGHSRTPVRRPRHHGSRHLHAEWSHDAMVLGTEKRACSGDLSGSESLFQPLARA
jgi:Kef-type K+ transport system membrane component KefB